MYVETDKGIKGLAAKCLFRLRYVELNFLKKYFGSFLGSTIGVM